MFTGKIGILQKIHCKNRGGLAGQGGWSIDVPALSANSFAVATIRTNIHKVSSTCH
jgi:hypothetical protein